MVGKSLGRYEVLEQLGAGGMGIVYRARDSRLSREVALKVLPPGLLADERARKRFRREALALSRLNHPNIATVHDFDSVDGVDFIVMELVDGSSVAAGARSLSEERLMAIGTQLAEGVAAAHAAGVLHKDLKPANLRLTPDGRLKILDFGLATLVKPSTELSETAQMSERDQLAGTLPYMAPEQLNGTADERSDIYQAGMVLYELATGRRAFHETTAVQMMHAILHATPPPPRSLNPSIPQEIEAIIVKATDKAPERRYQSARDLLVDLRRASGSAVSSSPIPAAPRFRGRRALAAALVAAIVLAIGATVAWRSLRGAGGGAAGAASIAVLPLANVSSDPKQDYFADALTYELISQLGKVSHLRVTSRTSVVRYRGTKKPLREIARELGVEKIIEGAVLREGERVRVTLNLVDAAEDRQVWSESYERGIRDILGLQGEIARAVASEVRVRLTPQETQRLAGEEVDPRAQEEYLRGVYMQMNMPMNPMMARGHFERAIQLAPKYAAPYAGLAESLVSIGFFVNPIAPMEVFPKIKELSIKALELDETNASAHVSLGVARLHSEWDWAGAEAEFRRAIELNPSWAPARHWYAHLLLALDRIDESVAESERAAALDPDNVMWGSCVGWHCLYARKYDEAVEHLKGVIAARPDQFLAYLYLGRAEQALGRNDEAIAAFRKSAQLSMGSATVDAALGYALAQAGKPAEARAILDRLMQRSRTGYVSAYDIAVVHAGLGDRDAAFEWLDKAYLERSAWLAHIKWDERFAGIRSDPRFAALVSKIRLPA